MPRMIRTDRLAFCGRGPCPLQLVKFCVDYEAVPETLQEVKYEPGDAVEKSKQDEIAEKPIGKSAQETRRASVQPVLEQPFPRRGASGVAGGDAPFGLLERHDFIVREPVVLIDPERDSLVVLVNDVVLKFLDPAVRNQHVFVHRAIL